jgi:hypothetical protein
VPSRDAFIAAFEQLGGSIRALARPLRLRPPPDLPVDRRPRHCRPALTVDLVPGAQGRLAIEAAVALARLAGDETGLPRVLQATAPSSADRLRAVEALRYFRDGAAQTALQGLQTDPDPRIRAMAAASLLHRSAG